MGRALDSEIMSSSLASFQHDKGSAGMLVYERAF